ncbi:MAG: pyruvate, phosphate dikinase, partial [Pseudomonadota bacterium]
MTQWVYQFGGGSADGDAQMRNLLGGKGANLAEMCRLGLPVPPGFTITTGVCTHYYDNGNSYPDELKTQVEAGIKGIESELGKEFGDPNDPLLVSVRSGARASMPGMMDTVLNLGLNDVTVEGIAKKTGDARFAYDSYRRFIQMYCDVVMGVEHFLFEDVLASIKRASGKDQDTDLTAEDWKAVVEEYKRTVKTEIDDTFPQDPWDQLWGAAGAVFGSWMNQRAITYRRLHGLPDEWGTAVNIQSMVYGNMGDDCATGVAFTRDPSTGENEFYGEYLINAQGEDVVAGIRTPQYITLKAKEANSADLPSMEEVMPTVFNQLLDVRDQLETHYADMQDIEFTVEKGRLFVLQTRSGKRTAPAALRIAVEMCQQGVIDKKQALQRVDPASLDQLLHPTLDPSAEKVIIGTGLPASPGAACGKIVLTADAAEQAAEKGETVILVREETSPEDIHGMHAAVGILTSRGGMTSHAAVVARGMGRPCVSGAGAFSIDAKSGMVHAGPHHLSAGDVITIDGGT